jgi:TatD DNase family protein
METGSVQLTDLVDIGANLTHESFEHDRHEVVARALAAGVSQMVITGSTVAQSTAAAELARSLNANWPGRFHATAGIHPHHASELNADSVPQLRDLCARPEVVSVGECGLDYHRNFSTPAEQRRCFAAQLELSVGTQLPVFLHQRDAHADFLAILREFRPHLSRAVAHCFTGGGDELEHYLELDLYVGITGWICDERRGHHLIDLVPSVPSGRLMVETDAPYLLPRDLRPRPKTRRNEPSNLAHVLLAVAGARGDPPPALAASTSRTAREFFAIPAPA